MKYLKIPLLALFGLGFASQSCGQAAALFQAGNQAFTGGDFVQAVQLYDSSLRVGEPSAETYYNLGCAYDKLAESGWAIWAYERALSLAPGHEDAAHNLALVEGRLLDVPELAEPWWTALGTTWGQASSWGWLSLGGMLLLLGMGSLYILGKSRLGRKWGFYGAVIGLVVALIGAGLMASIKLGTAQQTLGVIVEATSTVMDQPQGSEELGTLVAGTKFRWESDMGPWVKLSFENEADKTVVGYVAREHVQKI